MYFRFYFIECHSNFTLFPNKIIDIFFNISEHSFLEAHHNHFFNYI